MTDFLYWLLVQQSAWWSGAISVVMMWKMGSRVWWAPFLGLVGQVFWLLLAWFTSQPGMVVAALVYTFVHGRNARKWWVERRALQQRRMAIYLAPPIHRTRPKPEPPASGLARDPFTGQKLRWIDSPKGQGHWSYPPHG